MKTKALIPALALSTLFFAILLPPEAYPNGMLGVVLCSTFAFLAALSERRLPERYVRAGALLFAALLAHTFLFSIDVFRSLDMVTSLWTYYCLFGFFRYAGSGLEKQLAGTIVALSLIVSGYGLYQYFWGFDQIYNYVFYSSSDLVVKVPALDRIATRRVFSTLALPGTLWGFLLCALPLHAILWRRKYRLDALLLVSAALLLTTGFLTRSFGFLLGLLVLGFVALWMRYRRLVWNRLTPLVLLLAVAGGLFYSARRSSIEDGNPAGLRFKNWVSAWNIFAENPQGTGLNTFGVIYPVYMQPESNETQFVHNTPLQLLSELGYPLILAVLAIILVNARRIQLSRFIEALKSPQQFWLWLALCVWIVHNIVDINVYFQSVGVLGAILIGALFARPQAEYPKLSAGATGIAGALATLVIGFSIVVCFSGELRNRAKIEVENRKPHAAVETLAVARRISPLNSSLFHEAGEIYLNLYHQEHNRQYLDQATELFKRAVELSPKKSGSRVGYGLCLSTANRMSEAIEQIRIAQELYPSSAYVQSIAQLMDQRIQ